MFNSYDMSALGTYLKNIRNNMKYTQQEVAQRAKINVETIRRIENGKVTPKYETIEILSIVYRKDLMPIFSMFRGSQTLFELYESIDRVIIDPNKPSLDLLDEKLNEITHDPVEIGLVNIDELEQLKLFVNGIRDYYSKDYKDGIEKLVKAMQLTHVQFSMDEPTASKMNMFELRILLVISLCLTQLGEYKKAIVIMKRLLKLLLLGFRIDRDSIQLITKLHFNISYNFYNLDDHISTIKYTDEGIRFCRSHDSMYCLYLLYYRRAISKKEIGNRGYMKDLQSCYQLLTIMGRNDLVKTYKRITKERHMIE